MSFDPHQKQREADARYWAGFRGEPTGRYTSEHMMGSLLAGRDHNTGQLFHQCNPPTSTKRTVSRPGSSTGDTAGIVLLVIIFGLLGFVWIAGIWAFESGR
jgi:hypothetical protein